MGHSLLVYVHTAVLAQAVVMRVEQIRQVVPLEKRKLLFIGLPLLTSAA